MRKLIFLLLIFHFFVHADEKNKDIFVNPWEFDTKNIPIFTGPCASFSRGSLEKKEAVLLIDSIFKKNGYNLKKDYKFKYNDIEFILSGFDEKNKVGYIFGAGDNLDEDVLIHSNQPEKGQELDPATLLHDYLGKEYDERLEIAEDMTDKGKQQKYLSELVHEFRKKKSHLLISADEIKSLPEVYRKEKILILFISQFDSRFQYEKWVEKLIIEGEEKIKEFHASIEKSKKLLTELSEKGEKRQLEDERSTIKQYEDFLLDYDKILNKLKPHSKPAAVEKLTQYVQSSLDWFKQKKSIKEKTLQSTGQ